LSTPRAGAFARAGNEFNDDRTAARLQTPSGNALSSECCVPNAAAVRLKKPATGFPARAFATRATMETCR